MFDDDYTINYGNEDSPMEMTMAELYAEAYGYEDLNPTLVKKMRIRLEKKAQESWEADDCT